MTRTTWRPCSPSSHRRPHLSRRPHFSPHRLRRFAQPRLSPHRHCRRHRPSLAPTAGTGTAASHGHPPPATTSNSPRSPTSACSAANPRPPPSVRVRPTSTGYPALCPPPLPPNQEGEWRLARGRSRPPPRSRVLSKLINTTKMMSLMVSFLGRLLTALCTSDVNDNQQSCLYSL